jgi:anti-sigma regulatory factor (Ser/Thr protein kinase)
MKDRSGLRSSNSLTIKAKYENLERISNFIDDFARDAGFKENSLYNIKTAVDEACSNIIEHAYKGALSGDIECVCTMKGDNLEIVLHDHGIPFDPDSIPTPDMTNLLNMPADGGLGLYFMRTLMDEVQFNFSSSDGNYVTMIKHRE